MDVKLSFLGARCLLCSGKTSNLWCAGCERDMLSKEKGCPVCAKPGFNNRTCGACLKNKPDYCSTKVLFQYQYPVNHLIRTFKFNGRPELSIVFAELMAKKLSREVKNLPETLIPVPLHKKRQRQRGYNQSLVFATQITRHIGVKTESKLCQRIRDTKAQSTLLFSDRRKNMTGAFVLTSPSVPKHVAIIDDVITSGSTVNELAGLLKKAGCKKIDVWAIART